MLCDKDKRAIYDQYGEEGLMASFIDEDDDFEGGTQFIFTTQGWNPFSMLESQFFFNAGWGTPRWGLDPFENFFRTGWDRDPFEEFFRPFPINRRMR